MKLKQISLFLENKPGHLSSVCKTLAEEGINILTLSLADTRQFGILRLIVEDWERAVQVLQAHGGVVNITEVVAIEIGDHPGGLAEVLQALDAIGANIEYMYAFSLRNHDRAVMVFRFDDPDAAVVTLQKKGFGVLNGVELFGRAKK